jgi:hypothetical protein
MQRLIYISSAQLNLSDQDLDDILKESVAFNSKYWITGILLFNGINFLQLLEGTTGLVENLYARIVKDPRHFSVVTVLKEPSDARIFPNWSMRLKRRRASAMPASVNVDDFSDVQAHTMPDHISRIFANFDTLKG